jgi:hypothetical protein
MLADSFTKPVQGSQFRKLRSQIQGIPADTNDTLMGWDRPCLKPKTGPKQGSPSPHERGGTKTIRTNGTLSTPGSIKDTIPSANASASIKETIPSTNASATGSILTTHCATRRPTSRRITSYVEIARRALKLPTRSALYLNNLSLLKYYFRRQMADPNGGQFNIHHPCHCFLEPCPISAAATVTEI